MEPLNRNLEYFLKVAGASSFREAAVRLGVTQSSLSISIKKLEEQIGSPLFVRSKQGIELTSRGKQLHDRLRQVRRTIQDEIELSGEAENLAPIRIGSVAHFGNRHFLPAVKKLREQLPPLQIFLGYSKTILDSVQDGRLDFGILCWSHRIKNLKYIELQQDPIAIVGLKEKYPHLARVKNVKELQNETWIFHQKPQYDWTRYLVSTQPAYVVDNYLNFTELLLLGMGIGEAQLEHFSTAELKRLAICRLTLSNPQFAYLIYRPDAPVRIQSYAQLLVAELKK